MPLAVKQIINDLQLDIENMEFEKSMWISSARYLEALAKPIVITDMQFARAGVKEVCRRYRQSLMQQIKNWRKKIEIRPSFKIFHEEY